MEIYSNFRRLKLITLNVINPSASNSSNLNKVLKLCIVKHIPALFKIYLITLNFSIQIMDVIKLENSACYFPGLLLCWFVTN